MLTIQALEKKLIKDVRPLYLKTDKAHSIDHIYAVMTNVSLICFKLRRMDVLRVALVAAAYHDIYSASHIKEKFGAGNVGSVPEWYGEVFKEGLESRWNDIDALDESFFTSERIAQWEDELNTNHE